MNDIRRTILWVIFGFSMVLLWDQWQIHNGNKPTFFPPAPSKTAEQGGGAANATGGVPNASASASASGAAPTLGAAPGAGVPTPQGSSVAREKHEIKTDVLHLVIDGEGANIVRADLLAFKNHGQADQSMRLLSDSRELMYQAQSGVDPRPQCQHPDTQDPDADGEPGHAAERGPRPAGGGV